MFLKLWLEVWKKNHEIRIYLHNILLYYTTYFSQNNINNVFFFLMLLFKNDYLQSILCYNKA